MKIKIVTTGGTIDKLYFDAKSEYEIGAPQIGEILHAMHVAFSFDVVSLLRKDSLELTTEDRELICETIAKDDTERFIVTHGTDTMVETAKALQQLDEKVIVLTGALNPARFIGSDAVFNIGCAVAAVQAMPPGVYIAMNGRIWNPNRVRKNREENRFESF